MNDEVDLIDENDFDEEVCDTEEDLDDEVIVDESNIDYDSAEEGALSQAKGYL